MMDRMVVMIPALNPDERLVGLVNELRQKDFSRIIVIDDGSVDQYQPVFDKVHSSGAIVAVHKSNRGKGAALKTGVRTAIECFGEGNSYITADADGQHLPEDIRAVGDALTGHPDSLVLGVRDFDSPDVPWKSRYGNRITSFFFGITNGMVCPDTQTGLRGIPARLEKLALSEEGDRYEYEMNFLMDAAGTVPFVYVSIRTVYQDGNKGSHFRPVADSLRVYGRLLRYIAGSLAGAAVDYPLFYLFAVLLPFPQIQRVFMASVFARIGSGIVNYLLTRYWIFHSRRSIGGEAARYGLLFVAQMATSAALVSLLSLVLWPVAAKLVVDTFLFFVSFMIQKNWVFRKEEAR